MLSKELREIVMKEKDIIPFLKRLTVQDKKELVPFLKKLREEVFAYENTLSWNTHRKPAHTEKQKELVIQACFLSFNKTDVKREWMIHQFFSYSFLTDTLPWYTPTWFNDLVNSEIPWALSYQKMMELYKKDYLQPSQELIINKLPNAIIERQHDNGQQKNIYKPETLLAYEETLHEHIWLLFENESDINNYYSYLGLDNYKDGNDVWAHTIINLIKDQKLDRKEVILATIHTATRGFNKRLSGWFYDLLTKLSPNKTEILDLQKAFFAALNSPHSKVVNTVLKLFKTICSHKEFNHQAFIENASILLNSETKSVVNATLIILDKVGKTNEHLQIAVSKTAAETLINTDEKIQNRAAKLIEKFGKPSNEELKQEISLYADNLFHSSKEVLSAYIDQVDEVEDFQVEKTDLLAEHNRLPEYTTLDDLIFFVSQSIDNNEVYHLDLLMSCLPKLNVLLDAGNVARLAPIFKRSFDLSINFEWNSRIGELETVAAIYINDFSKKQIKKYPQALESFITYRNKEIKKVTHQGYYQEYYANNLRPLEKRASSDYIYKVHETLFIKSNQLIEKGLTLDLISLPTHTPCWIDPKVLIDRIVSYEALDEIVNLFDLQVAIGRIPLLQPSPDIEQQIDKIQHKEIRNVLKYQFDLCDLQHQSIDRPELWIQSILNKNKSADIQHFRDLSGLSLKRELNNYKWSCKQETDTYQEWDYTQNKNLQKEIVRNRLKVHLYDNKVEKPESLITSLKKAFRKKKDTKTSIENIYNLLYLQEQQYYTIIRSHDDVKFLFLTPNNPGLLLTYMVHYNLRFSTFSEENGKKNMINLLKGLYEIWYRPDFHESTYLFLATGLLCSDKVSRELAGEIWIKAISENTMDNKRLGQIIGKLESSEYAPLKRFTDLLSNSLFNISKAHNASLLTLLDNMIGEMSNDAIRGLRKLLELFLELKYNSLEFEISQASKEKFTEWKNSNSLKSLIVKIES